MSELMHRRAVAANVGAMSAAHVMLQDEVITSLQESSITRVSIK
jgi:hypothetical protein